MAFPSIYPEVKKVFFVKAGKFYFWSKVQSWLHQIHTWEVLRLGQGHKIFTKRENNKKSSK